MHECPYTFTMDRKKCPNTITAGCDPNPNIAPEATYFLNPELDNVPKQKLNLHFGGLEKEDFKDLVAYNH